MEKKLVRDYTFNATAKTIKAVEFTDLNKIALITNVTDNIVIFDTLDSTLKGTLSGTTLTLDYDTTAMADTDKLQILIRPTNDIDRIGYTKTLAGVDTNFYDLVRTGTGMGINQTGGNLVITAGTTARSESIIRSKKSYSGGVRMRTHHLLSQRVANQQFFIELVDVIGDGLAYTINSATSLTVTFPAGHGFTSENVGQFVSIGNFNGTGTFLSGRYAIASVSVDNITFTVSGFAVGSGTCSAFGWNFYRLEYSGTTATSALFDTGRNGWSLGNTTATISTTASPGHMAIITGNDGVSSFQDQLIASATGIQTVVRSSRVTAVPDDVNLYYQIRIVNGATAPTATTWTIGQSSIAMYEPESVVIQDVRPVSLGTALPTVVLNTPNVTLSSTTLTAVTPGTGATNSHKARDGAAGATDTNQPIMLIRRDAPTAVTPVVGDYEVPQMTNLGAQYVAPTAHTAGGATPYRLISAATTNATSVKASAGQIYSLTAMNTNASVRYLKLYNLATAPTVGTSTPVQVYALPPNGGITLSLPVGMAFSTGIALATTTGAADTDTGAVALNEIVISLTFL